MGRLCPLHGTKAKKPSPSPVSPMGCVQHGSAYTDGALPRAGREETKVSPLSCFLSSRAFLALGAAVHRLGG